MYKIKKVKLGKTDLEIPTLGLGTSFLARPSMLVPEREAIEMVQHAFSKGINFFDTAPYYGAGNAERRLGKALEGVPRDSFILETKVGRLVEPDGSVVFDYSKEGIERSLAESLKRLKMDRIDIALMHDPDIVFTNFKQAQEIVELLLHWRKQGIVRAIGVGTNYWEPLVEYAKQADFDCFLLAGRYTLLEQKAATEFLPLCLEKGIGVFVGGVYNSGILATGPIPGAYYNYGEANEVVKEQVRRIEKICQRHNVPLSVAALQFPTANQAVTCMIVGAKTISEIDENFQKLEQTIPIALWDELKEEGLVEKEVPVPV